MHTTFAPFSTGIYVFPFWFLRILYNHTFIISVVHTFFWFIILFDLANSNSSCRFDRNDCFSYNQIHHFLWLLGFLLMFLFNFFLFLSGYFLIIILDFCVNSLKFLLIKFYIQQIFLFHRFCICKFVCLLKFICNPRISICGTFTTIHGHMPRDEKFESPDTNILS